MKYYCLSFIFMKKKKKKLTINWKISVTTVHGHVKPGNIRKFCLIYRHGKVLEIIIKILILPIKSNRNLKLNSIRYLLLYSVSLTRNCECNIHKMIFKSPNPVITINWIGQKLCRNPVQLIQYQLRLSKLYIKIYVFIILIVWYHWKGPPKSQF